MRMSRKTIMIACRMIEDELNDAIERHGIDMEIIWMERGYHDDPDDLRNAVAEQIIVAEERGAEEILIAYGLCGKGAVGWRSDVATLVMPKFDDCVNMMLCPKVRDRRAYLEPGKMYLTEGWTQEKGSLKNLLAACREKYGERKGLRAVKLMLDSYDRITIIDTGCYDLEPVREYAADCARELDLTVDTVPGSTNVMEKLISGEWDDDIIVKAPGEAITEEDFEFK